MGDRGPGGQAPVAALLDPGDHEDVVVHREAEEDHEEEQRHPGLDRADARGAEQRGPDAVLEDQGQHAVRGADREQVEHHGGAGDGQRAEGGEHEQEGEGHHEAEDHRHRAGHLGVEVVGAGGAAGDRGLGAGHREHGGGHEVLAQGAQGGVADRVVAAAVERDVDGGDVLLGVDGDVDRSVHPAGGQGAGLEVGDRGGHRGGVDVGGPDHHGGGRGAAGEGCLDLLRDGDQLVALRQLLLEGQVGGVHGEQRRGQADQDGAGQGGGGQRAAQHRGEHGVPEPAAGGGGVGAAEPVEEGHPALVDPVAEHREQCGQHGERAEHGGDDDHDGGVRHGLELGDAGEEHAGHGDHHGDAGDQQGPAAGGGGDPQRGVEVASGGPLLAFAAQVEEAVVDADGEADQQHHRAGAVAGVQDPAAEGDESAGRDEGGDREQDGQDGGDQRAEGDQQDAEGEGDGRPLGAGEVVGELLVHPLA